MKVFQFDSSHSFGTVDLSGSDLVFPNNLNLGKTDADAMSVVLRVPVPLEGGTGLTVTVLGAANPEDTTGTAVGVNTVSTDKIAGGFAEVAISPNDFPVLVVTIAKNGTFTAGTVEAILNTYVGT